MFKWYNCIDDKKKLDKSPVLLNTDDETVIFGDCSVLSPVLKAKTYSGNYVYIEQFNKYYFIRNAVWSHGFYFIYCEIDALYSNLTEIENLETLVVRNENSNLSFIPDTAVITTVDKNIRTALLTDGVKMGNVHNSRNFVLTVV